MTSRRSRKKATPTISKRRAQVGGGVSDSVIIPGDRNVVHVSRASDSLARAALRQLRPPVGDFVGREREVETLIKALRDGSRASISGINGMGGIGKTELALYVAERLADDYPDAQLFINLQGTDPNPRSPEQVMEICIRAFLGPEVRLPEDLDQLSPIYRNQLSGKRALLLLDNAADSAQIRPLLPPAGSVLLVTSRHAITLPGMTRFTLNPLTDKEARDLLLKIAPNAESAADEICKLCGYLPLAICAAGSLLAITPDLDAVEYAARLEDEHNRLERIGAEGVEIGVAASFNLSYARLTPEAARVFRLLSVFAGTFDARAAEVVCSDVEHVILSDLVRRSLVIYDASTTRYRLHDLARLFAGSKLSDAERVVGLRRHATHYTDVLRTVNELYLQGGEALTSGLALFDLEWGNIQAGHAWVARQGVEADEDTTRLGITYADAGVYILSLRQHSRERIRWLEIALTAAQRLKDRAHEGAALTHMGLAYGNLGETKRAIEFYEQALLIDRELGDRRGEGADLGNLGVAYKNLGEPRRAIQFYEQALLIDRELGDRRGEGIDLGNLGVAYQNLGETQRAIQFYEQALVIAREIGDRRGEGNTLGNLGLAYAVLGETKRAIEFYEQALVIVREIGDRRGEGAALGNLGLAYADLGETKRAIEFYKQRLVIAREIGDRRGEGNALGNLGLAYAVLGETKRAIQFYEKQLIIVREIGDRRGEANALSNMSLALDKLGQRAQAIQHAQQSLAIREQIEDPYAAKVRAKLDKWAGETPSN